MEKYVTYDLRKLNSSNLAGSLLSKDDNSSTTTTQAEVVIVRVHLDQHLSDVLVEVALPAKVRALHHRQLLPVEHLRILRLFPAFPHFPRIIESEPTLIKVTCRSSLPVIKQVT
jgi:hypothetical protein